MRIFVGAIFVAALAISVLGQFDVPLAQRVRAHDPLGLIPRWTFFAPRPGQTDYHLMVEVFAGQESHGWREQPLAGGRSVVGALWNPSKRHRKALADLVRSMMRSSRALGREDRWQVQYTVPYIALLSYLSAQARLGGGTHVRFMIVESEGFYRTQQPRPLFISARHAVD